MTVTTDNEITEQVILVDPHDTQIGIAEKLIAHQYAMLHRAFSVFIFRQVNNTTELLLQQRKYSKYHCGGLWSNTCCSHPRPSENILNAGKRRLWEEMRLDAPLLHIGHFHYVAVFNNGLVENEIDHVLIGRTSKKHVDINQEEVENYHWVKITDLREDLITMPEKYTPWLMKALNIATGNFNSLFKYI